MCRGAGGPCGRAEGHGGGLGGAVWKNLDVGSGTREPTELGVCVDGDCGWLCSWLGPACRVEAAARLGGRARAHTVKMLERRLDCLRMGVGVEEAAMVSMRSSRWLTLGVEGTEDE